jgi:ABC-2 type transport system permease protein
VALAVAWIRSLGRALVTADASTQSAAVHGGALPLGRYGLRGTVAARFWIYQRRDPVSLIYWGIVAVIMGACSVSTILTPSYQVGLFISAVFGAAFTGVFRANTIGLTGPGFGLEAIALSGRRAWRAYFCGQDLAVGVIAVPLLAAVSFGLAAVARHPADGFSGLAVDLAGIGAALALANIFTAALAYPAEKRPGNPTPRAASGYTGLTVAGTFGTLAAVAVLAVPVMAGWELSRSAPAAVRMPVLAACAAGYGLALAWLGVQIAARVAEQKLPELYQIAVRSKL